MATLIEYPTAKGQGDLSQDELQHLDESAKLARRELVDFTATKLEECEPGASRSEVFTAIEKVAKARKASRKHD